MRLAGLVSTRSEILGNFLADTQTRNSKVEEIGSHPSKSELIILTTGIG
jgi:hypothetical protein